MGGFGAASEQMNVDRCLFPSGFDLRKFKKKLGKKIGCAMVFQRTGYDPAQCSYREIGVIEVGKNEGQSMRVAWVFGRAISLVRSNTTDSFTLEGYRTRKRWVT
jgi:hypothetical protein